MQTFIKEYLRDLPMADETRGEPIGVMLASLKNNKLAFGWSVLHPKDQENHKYNKHLGDLIASNRLNTFDPDVEEVLIVPEIMVDMMERFAERAERYFRVKNNVRVLDGFKLSTNGHSRDKK